MKPWERWVVEGANLLVAGTGLVYAVMLHLLSPVDEWAVVNHPWQPQVQHLHVLTSPLLVFACGLIWQRHVASHLRRGERQGRATGKGLLLALAPMVLSGYLIQTTVTESWRQVWIVVHLIASTAWILTFAVHAVRALRQRRGRPTTA